MNAIDIAGRTPLYIAARNDCFKVVKFLLENGADIRMQSLKGSTAFDAAPKGSLSKEILRRWKLQ